MTSSAPDEEIFILSDEIIDYIIGFQSGDGAQAHPEGGAS